MGDLSKDNLLRSWKDISAYLGCDVRTCHRWEANHGMPVHRAEGGETKSPVFAYRDELDAWFRDTFKNGHPAKDKAGSGRPRLKWAISGAGLLVLAGVFFIVRPFRKGGQPADFRIEGSWFIVTDKDQRELWRKNTRFEDLRFEKFYRDNFQVVNKDTGNILPVLIIKDINGDGDAEVLFAPKRRRDQTGEGWLYCYDRRGVELWHFQAGKELRCGGKTFSPDYRVAGFLCHDLDGDGRLETIVESFQAPDWPCQLAVLDSNGAKIGEFWNAGYLREFTFHDINGDGREELIVGGVNNEYQGGCLAVFDTRHISGSSPQTGEFACEGLGPGSMLYYVTTPYTEVSKAERFWVNGISFVEITQNDWIQLSSGEGLIYAFDFGLKCLQVSGGHSFKLRHQDMVEAGKITSVIDDAYWQRLVEGIRWWNGSAMVPEPSMVAR
jgi:hypothetical protein